MKSFTLPQHANNVLKCGRFTSPSKEISNIVSTATQVSIVSFTTCWILWNIVFTATGLLQVDKRSSIILNKSVVLLYDGIWYILPWSISIAIWASSVVTTWSVRSGYTASGVDISAIHGCTIETA